MIRSLKAAFGLSLVAALVMSVVGVFGASATTSGHFSSESAKTTYNITENTETTHKTELSAFSATVSCHEVKYTGAQTNTAIFSALTVTPEYKSCTSGSGVAHVRMNGCHYVFTPRTTGHATAHFLCPTGKKAEVESTSTGSTMKFGAQTPTTNGVTYSAIVIDGKNALTTNITVEGIHGECHGACQIFGTTTTTGKLLGSVTVQGKDATTGIVTGIKAT
jgi:hypothetical protein